MFKTKNKLDLADRATNFSDREQRMHDFLKENPAGVLSTVTPDNNPHGVVVYFYVDAYFNIYFVTKTETRKFDNLKHNNHVMLSVFEKSSQSVVQVTGKAEEIKDKVELNSIAGKVFGASKRINKTGIMPIAKLEAGSYTGFKIKPQQARMAVYSRPDPGEYEEMFESIESFDLET